MKTTRSQAKLLYQITNHIDPYNSDDSSIKELMKKSIESNLKELEKYLCDYFDSIKELLDNYYLMTLVGKLYNNYYNAKIREKASEIEQTKANIKKVFGENLKTTKLPF